MERIGALLSPDVVLDVRSSGALVRRSGWCAVVDEFDQGALNVDSFIGGDDAASLELDADGWSVKSLSVDGRSVEARTFVVAGRVEGCSLSIE
jgi:hypothetical protein